MRHASPQQIDRFLGQISREESATLLFDWPLLARPKKLPPAGRGFGKTRAGAEWVRALATAGAARRIALVGDTADDVRHVMVEGPSGVLAIAPADERPVWQRSLRRLEWPNGVVARCYSAADPEQLRGGGTSG